MSENKTLECSSDETANEWKVGPGAWISLIIVLLVFSGLLFKVEGMAWLGAFDFTTLGGCVRHHENAGNQHLYRQRRHSAKAGFLFAVAGADGDAGAGAAGDIYPLRGDPRGA